MLIEMLLELIKSILGIMLFFEIPQLPAEVHSYISQMFEALVSGASILANYVPLSYLLVLFGIILAIDVGINVYHFVMWILRKIPMLGID